MGTSLALPLVFNSPWRRKFKLLFSTPVAIHGSSTTTELYSCRLPVYPHHIFLIGSKTPIVRKTVLLLCCIRASHLITWLISIVVSTTSFDFINFGCYCRPSPFCYLMGWQIRIIREPMALRFVLSCRCPRGERLPVIRFWPQQMVLLLVIAVFPKSVYLEPTAYR